MQAKMLMLGDLVSFKGSDITHQVKAIAGKSIKVDKDKWYSANTLQPIPLTPEILKKNGFEDINDIYIARCTNIHYPCPIFIEYCCANNCLYINDGLIPEPILYVHQLQHAFSLCGIDKEITL